MTQDRSFRLGLIGGRWGVNYLRTAAAMEGISIPVVVRAHNIPLPEPFQTIPLMTDWRTLADPAWQLDGVIIVAPPSLHVEMATSFINSNIPVVLEKPLCLDLTQARQLTELAAQKKAIVWVDHTHLFHPAFLTLKTLTRGKRIKSIYSRAGNYGPFRHDVPVFWDWMPHDVAMILDLIGEYPSSISARVLEENLTPDGQGSTVELDMKFPGDLLTHTEVTNMHATKTRLLWVQTETAWYCYNGIDHPSLSVIPGSVKFSELSNVPGESISISAVKPLENLLGLFRQAILDTDYSNESLYLGCKVIEVIDAGWRNINRSSGKYPI